MIDLVNGITLFITGLIAGAAIHSLWRHAIERKELQQWNEFIREEDYEEI